MREIKYDKKTYCPYQQTYSRSIAIINVGSTVCGMCKHYAGRYDEYFSNSHNRKNSILCEMDESIEKQNIMYPFLLIENRSVNFY
jgi:hypothetical protein